MKKLLSFILPLVATSALAQTNYVGSIVASGSIVGNISGTNLISSTVNSNSLDTATKAQLALAGTSSGVASIPQLNGRGTNTYIENLSNNIIRVTSSIWQVNDNLNVPRFLFDSSGTYMYDGTLGGVNRVTALQSGSVIISDTLGNAVLTISSSGALSATGAATVTNSGNIFRGKFYDGHTQANPPVISGINAAITNVTILQSGGTDHVMSLWVVANAATTANIPLLTVTYGVPFSSTVYPVLTFCSTNSSTYHPPMAFIPSASAFQLGFGTALAAGQTNIVSVYVPGPEGDGK